ncbi:MAG: CGGC domain-containing protein [Syntrophomonadaceae bacterium]|jgi:predicted metal-binding protein
MKWTDEAREEMQKVPGFVRKMAIKAVESEAKKQNLQEITLDHVIRVRNKYIKFAEDNDNLKKTRIAIVRCEAVSEVCPGIACFKAFNARRIHFKQYDENTEIIGFFTCGGCPGRRISRLADTLQKHHVDAIHLSSCMLLEGDYPPCPHIDEIKKNLESKGIKIVEGTHH